VTISTTVHESVEEIKRGEWNAVVAEQSKTGSVFERYEWLHAYEDAHDATPAHVQIRKNGTLVGVHPLFERELPGTPARFLGPPRPEYNGALVTTDEHAVLGAILDAVGDRCRRTTIGHLLKPCSSRSLGYARFLRDHDYYPTVRGCHFVLDTTRSWEAVRAGMDRGKRRNLDRADDDGVTTRELPVTEETLRSFHDAHQRNMERISGTGATLAFLQALERHMADRLVLFVAEVDGDAIGHLFCVVDREQDQLHLLFPGYRPDERQQFPAEVLYRAAIQWAIDSELSGCNFGETEPDIEDGTYRFKTKFGATAVPTLRWEKVHSRLGRLFYLLGGEAVIGALFSKRQRAGPEATPE
jgi:predicted N-acyltransferase